MLKNEDLGKLVLRVSIGFLMLFYGMDKIINGIGGLDAMFKSMGIPGFFAYAIYLGQVFAPLMLILGFKVRIAAILLAGTMVIAILLAHTGDIFSLNKHGAWAIELQMFYILTSLSIVFLGDDKYQILNKQKNRKFLNEQV